MYGFHAKRISLGTQGFLHWVFLGFSKGAFVNNLKLVKCLPSWIAPLFSVYPVSTRFSGEQSTRFLSGFDYFCNVAVGVAQDVFWPAFFSSIAVVNA